MNTTELTTARWHLNNHARFPWGSDVSDAVLALINDKLGYPAPGTAIESLVPIAPLPASGAEPLIALCLGHGRAGDEGAVSVAGVSEEEYNLPLIEAIESRLIACGVRVVVIPFYEGNSYGEAMRWLAGHLLKLGVTAAIEFHFNASDGKARGHEVLHWKNSVRGVQLASCVLSALDLALPTHASRGLKPKTAVDRGALFLALTHCPVIIAESFFGDNPEEWERFDDIEEVPVLAGAYTNGILRFLEGQRQAA